MKKSSLNIFLLAIIPSITAVTTIVIVSNSSSLEAINIFKCQQLQLGFPAIFVRDTNKLFELAEQSLSAKIPVAITTLNSIWLSNVSKKMELKLLSLSIDFAGLYDEKKGKFHDFLFFKNSMTTEKFFRNRPKLRQSLDFFSLFNDLVTVKKIDSDFLMSFFTAILTRINVNNHFYDMKGLNLASPFFVKDSKFFTSTKNYINGTPWPISILVSNFEFYKSDMKKLQMWPLADDINGNSTKKSSLFSKSSCTNLPKINPKQTPIYITKTKFQAPELIIKILTFNRPASLQRLLNSLSNAEYSFVDRKKTWKVNIEICIDHPEKPSVQSMDVKLAVIKVAEEWEWKYGSKMVNVRYVHAGLAAQWYEGWYPTHDNQFVIFLEDDLEVSKKWFLFMQVAIDKYYFTLKRDPNIFGISLQGQTTCLGGACKVNLPPSAPSIKESKNPNTSKFQLFKYQLVGTWGQLLFPKLWRDFLVWLDEKKINVVDSNNANWNNPFIYKPLFSNLKSNKWWLNDKYNRKAWSFYFIAFVAENGYYNLYPHFEGGKIALVKNHKEPGVHYSKKLSPDKILVDEENWDDSYLDAMPKTLESLGVYDFHFEYTDSPGELANRRYAFIGNPGDDVIQIE